MNKTETRKWCIRYDFPGDDAIYFAFYETDTFGEYWRIARFVGTEEPHEQLGIVRKGGAKSDYTWRFKDWDGQQRTMAGKSIRAGVDYLRRNN